MEEIKKESEECVKSCQSDTESEFDDNKMLIEQEVLPDIITKTYQRVSNLRSNKLVRPSLEKEAEIETIYKDVHNFDGC